MPHFVQEVLASLSVLYSGGCSSKTLKRSAQLNSSEHQPLGSGTIRSLQLERLLADRKLVHRSTRRLILRNVREWFWFCPENPTKRYALRVSTNASDRAVLESLMLLNEWEKGIQDSAGVCFRRGVPEEERQSWGALSAEEQRLILSLGSCTGETNSSWSSGADHLRGQETEKENRQHGQNHDSSTGHDPMPLPDLSQYQDQDHFRNCGSKILHAGGSLLLTNDHFPVFFCDYASSLSATVGGFLGPTPADIIERLCLILEKSAAPAYTKLRAVRQITPLLNLSLSHFLKLLKVFPEGSGWLDEADLQSKNELTDHDEPRVELFCMLFCRCPDREEVCSTKLLYNRKVVSRPGGFFSDRAQGEISARLGPLRTMNLQVGPKKTEDFLKTNKMHLDCAVPEDRVRLWILYAVAKVEENCLLDLWAEGEEDADEEQVANSYPPSRNRNKPMTAISEVFDAAVAIARDAEKLDAFRRREEREQQRLQLPEDVTRLPSRGPSSTGRASTWRSLDDVPLKGKAVVRLADRGRGGGGAPREQFRRWLWLRWCRPVVADRG
eukprot:g20436.t1